MTAILISTNYPSRLIEKYITKRKAHISSVNINNNDNNNVPNSKTNVYGFYGLYGHVTTCRCSSRRFYPAMKFLLSSEGAGHCKTLHIEMAALWRMPYGPMVSNLVCAVYFPYYPDV